MKTKLISKIAGIIEAMENCKKSQNEVWLKNHSQYLAEIEKNHLPHGSGLDVGCNIDLEKSNSKKIVILTSWHNMNENGYYCGWSDFTINCYPSFRGIELKIIGKDKYYVKEYLYDLFYDVLEREIEFEPVS
jgi:hypothetical protein